MTNLFGHCIKQATFVAAPPEKVYDTITSAEAWNAFFTTGMTLDPAPDGDCTFRWKDWGPDFYTFAVPGKVIAAVRPTRFVFQWGSENPTTITFNLTAEHGGTAIRLTEDGHFDTPQGRDAALECAAGWGEALTLLKFYIEHGIVCTKPTRDA